ncbi:AF9 protein, partial [Dromaius novaehollandiae]|nr:AF9 protein [Dromaius novaehollandiae]
VCKDPPYKVEESGYAGFILPIEVYFKNKEEPKKVRFDYDLFLHLEGHPPVNHLRCEKLTFNNPTEEFRRKLLKAGGIMVMSDGTSFPSGQNLHLPNLPGHSLSFLEVKKKSSHGLKDPAKNMNANSSSSSSNSFSKPHKLTKEHKEKILKDSKEHKKLHAFQLLSHIKDNFSSSPSWPVLPKEPVAIHCSIPVMRAIPPRLHNLNEIIALQLHTDLKILLSIPHAACFCVQALQGGTQACRFPRKGVRGFPMVLSCRHFLACMQVLEVPPLEPCFVDLLSKSIHYNVFCFKSEQPSPASSSSSSSLTPSQSSRQQGPLQSIMKDLHSDDNQDESDGTDKNDNDSELERPVNTHEGSKSHRVSLIDGSDSDSSSASSLLHREPPPPLLKTSNNQILEVKSPIKQNKSDKQIKNGDCDKAYLDELVELHRRLMTLRERHVLQQIVNLIEETGHFHITNTTFDFDLCSLDKTTVRKLQSYLETPGTS